MSHYTSILCKCNIHNGTTLTETMSSNLNQAGLSNLYWHQLVVENLLMN